MNIYLYTFSKKERSTRIPSGGTQYTGRLREPSGIIAPTVGIQGSATWDPSKLNYAYIPSFDRYYWIREWRFTPGSIWEAYMEVDVLASWKSYIGNTQMYVLRASADSNGRVVDTKYPTLCRANTYIDNGGTVYELHSGTDVARANYWSKSLVQGYYYLGVVGNNSTGTTWYVMTPGSFNTLVNTLYAVTPSDMPSLDVGVAQELANPIQYITACYWLPTDVLGLTYGTDTIYFGRFPVTVNSVAKLDPVGSIRRYSQSFNIRKHPQAASRGLYLNQSPYSNYTIVIPAFGTFTLDSTLMVDDTTATAEWYIDYTTGIADFTIKVTNSFMVHSAAMMGIPIRLNQTSVDYIGAGMSLLGGVTSMAANLDTNLGGVVMGALSGITGAVNSMSPKLASTGGTGSFVPFHSYEPKIYSDFYWIADEFNDEIGRPLCQMRTPESLGGYIQAVEGDIEAPATSAELSQINGYITGGFFYE